MFNLVFYFVDNLESGLINLSHEGKSFVVVCSHNLGRRQISQGFVVVLVELRIANHRLLIALLRFLVPIHGVVYFPKSVVTRGHFLFMTVGENRLYCFFGLVQQSALQLLLSHLQVGIQT